MNRSNCQLIVLFLNSGPSSNTQNNSELRGRIAYHLLPDLVSAVDGKINACDERAGIARKIKSAAVEVGNAIETAQSPHHHVSRKGRLTGPCVP